MPFNTEQIDVTFSQKKIVKSSGINRLVIIKNHDKSGAVLAKNAAQLLDNGYLLSYNETVSVNLAAGEDIWAKSTSLVPTKLFVLEMEKL